MKKLKNITVNLEEDTIMSTIVLALIIVFVCSGINLFGTWNSAETINEELLEEAAKNIEGLESVKNALSGNGDFDIMEREIDDIVKSYYYLDYVDIYNMNGEIVYSSLKDENAALKSRYMVKNYGATDNSVVVREKRKGERILKVYIKVLSDSRQHMGYCAAAQNYSRVENVRSRFVLTSVIAAAGSLLIAVICSFFNSHRIKKKLYGKTTHEMREYLKTNFESMDELKEMIILMDENGELLLCNSVARNVLKINYAPYEKVNLKNFYPKSDFLTYAKKGKRISLVDYMVNGRYFIIEGTPIKVDNHNGHAYLIVGYDETEIKRMTEELAGKDTLIESLRIVNHDFKNRVHVLMGLLEIGDYAKAKEFIHSIQSVPTEQILSISKTVSNNSINALLVGKLIIAGEKGITLNVLSDSKCTELTKGIPEQEYITVIGNLIDNSIDELNRTDNGDKSVDVFVSTSTEWSIITVTDNGGGMTDEVKSHAFDMGYTTKSGNNRGIGLASIKRIAEAHNGKIDIETELEEGTSITVSFSI